MPFKRFVSRRVLPEPPVRPYRCWPRALTLTSWPDDKLETNCIVRFVNSFLGASIPRSRIVRRLQAKMAR
jgi:hypothetical protein